MRHNKLTATELIKATKSELLRLGYTDLTLREIERTWRHLGEYLRERNIEHFSKDVGIQFLENKYRFTLTSKLSNPDQDRIRAINLLADYQAQGIISIRRKSREYSFASQFAEIFNEFMDLRKNAGLSRKTLDSHIIYLERFSEYLDKHGVKCVTEIDVPEIIGFLNASAAIYHTATIYCTSCLLRVLFRYLYETTMIPKNLALFVPTVRYVKEAKVPSAYSKEEIQRLLASVDRGNPKGKRDYAIMLLAVRLGLRSTDICELAFENFKWESNIIQLQQRKTGESITLPLLNDVGEAVIDYLKYGRPSAQTNQVFLRLSAPIGPMVAPTLHSIVTYYMRKANITIQEGKKHGPHSLRHSLASALLDNNIPLPVISEILGHTDSGTTGAYLKIDTLRLREYSLGVSPLSVGFGGSF
jgi:site-specific recombinase XerD